MISGMPLQKAFPMYQDAIEAAVSHFRRAVPAVPVKVKGIFIHIIPRMSSFGSMNGIIFSCKQ